MELNQGNKLNVTERSEQILDAIFGKDREELDDVFSVFNSPSNNVGKIYLPIHISLTGLVDAKLSFRWDHDVRESKVVIHY